MRHGDAREELEKGRCREEKGTLRERLAYIDPNTKRGKDGNRQREAGKRAKRNGELGREGTQAPSHM